MDTLIVLAGGAGSRVGAAENKVYLKAGGRPLLWYPLEAAANFAEPVRTVVVIRSGNDLLAEEIAEKFPNNSLVEGGSTRFDSEREGLRSIASLVSEQDMVGVHDAARPFLTVDLWESCLRSARSHGGAIPVLDGSSLLRVDGDSFLPPGGALSRAQTPQVFRAAGLIAAFEAATQPGLDTAETVTRVRTLSVAAVPGDPRNIKVTFPVDLLRADQIARDWRAGRWLSL